MHQLSNQHVLILGLGISGLSMARWCVRHGANVTVADTREAPPSLAALHIECPRVRFVAGPFSEELLALHSWDVIARSPGLPPEQLVSARAWALQHGAAFVGELELFAQSLNDLSMREVFPYRPKVLAITGTNGKTTVTSLTGLLLQRAGWRVAVAGNIGPALLDVLGDALDAEARSQAAQADEAPVAACSTPDAGPVGGVSASETHEYPQDTAVEEPILSDGDSDVVAGRVPPPLRVPEPPHLPQVWVLELSSFQLDGAATGVWSGVPTAATVLNITEDHLDWHGSLDAYSQAKSAVWGTQALMVINRDDPRIMSMAPANVTVKVGGRHRQQPERAWTSFGLDVPSRAGDWGLESVNGMTWLVRALAVDETRVSRRTSMGPGAAGPADETYLQRLMPVDALRIRGRHNAANALAALALATSTSAALGPMLHGLREYRGEPHRVEPVAIIDGVEYFDDSKGTNVGATLAAIRGLGAERPLVVILGGEGKGQDFVPLAEPLARHARTVLLIGRDAPRIRAQVQAALDAAGVPLHDVVSVQDAVSFAAQRAEAGDAVLLSPACASLDMFRDYKHRAEVFVAAVRNLADERGISLEGGS
jgi:UDP-N-acetylmuramoylalanine--D-glutamate ligase